MAFAASDPLSELVWSPNKGLSLKRAESSLANKKPILLWNVGASSTCFESKGSGDDDKSLTTSQAFVNVDDECVNKATFILSSHNPEMVASRRHRQKRSSKIEEDTVATDATHKEESSKDIADVQNADIGLESQENAGTITQKLDFSAEDDSSHLTFKKAWSSGEIRIPRENSTKSRICLYREKGNMKALSDGDIYGRSPNNEEDDSHESEGICNSAKLFPKGVKRQSRNQEPTIGSKRMKKEMEGSYGSKFVVGNSSSFKNWISNLNNEESPVTNKKVDDSANEKMGFQTTLRSVCRNTKMSVTGIGTEGCSMEETKGFKLPEQTSVQNLRYRKADDSCQQIVVSNKEVNVQISENIVGQQNESWIFSADFTCTSLASESKSMEDEAFNVMVSKEKGLVNPSDSLLKQVSTAENTNFGVPLVTSNMPELCSSLWITRLCTRTKSENCNQVIQEAHDCSKKSINESLGNQVNDVILVDQKSSKAMNISAKDQVHDPEKEANAIVAKAWPFVDLNSSGEKNFIAPSTRFQVSEAVRSIFARPMDALERNVASEWKKSPSCSVTCFFCGKLGHDLRDCTMVTETELEDLLARISSSERVEESSIMCIRCFQLNHWAIACPLVSSSRYLPSEKDVSFMSHPAAGLVQICTRNAKFPCYLGKEEDLQPVAAGPSARNVEQASSKICPTSNEIRKSSALENLEIDLNYDPNIVKGQNKVASPEMLRAIRKLCLSRTDILRWMKSNISLTRLDGFFLRLRITKTEAGLGGMGYCAARISGDARENIGCELKKSILVDVGGIKSSVGSSYISNHDFEEDEIDAWWCRIVEAGGKTPSLDELNSRIKDRKNLGF